MDLDFTEEQEMLRATVRTMCAERAPLEVVRGIEDDPSGVPKEFWQHLIEMDLTGILIPEEFGGADLTMIDAAILYEEFGRALAPTPHFVSCVLAAGALLRAGNDAQKAEWLPPIAAGDAILTPAWLEPGNGYGPRGVQLRAERRDGAYHLSGSKLHVTFASAATRLLVLARTGDGDDEIDLLLVDPNSAGVELTQKLSLASDTQYRVELTDVVVPESDRIGAPGSGWQTWNAVMHDGIILAAAQAVGGAARALEMTVEFAKVREQFDRPIGAFQAISHYLASASTSVEGAITLTYQAAWARANAKSTARLAPMAKLFACQTYRDVTAMAQQVYGGVGFTVEYDIQLYFRRAKQLQLSWWDTRYLEELVASSVLDS
jgi:alkylation response protein AidB-like acyl-CoA dehydrogenase